MNPLLQLLARFGPRALSGARTGLLGMDPGMQDDLPAQALKRMQDQQSAQGVVSPQRRIMDAFEDMKSSRPVAQKGDSLMPSPSTTVDQGFNDLVAPLEATQPMQQQQPQAPQPMQQLPPIGQGGRRVTELPGRNPVPPPAAALPAPAPQLNEMPWWQRNGLMQRDMESGQYLDPAMAQRAMSGLFG